VYHLFFSTQYVPVTLLAPKRVIDTIDIRLYDKKFCCIGIQELWLSFLVSIGVEAFQIQYNTYVTHIFRNKLFLKNLCKPYVNNYPLFEKCLCYIFCSSVSDVLLFMKV
jgi:hypothetical protein